MKHNQILVKLFVLATLFSLALTACAPASEPTTLKIAVLPVIDALPMYVAQQEGLFEKHKVSVTFVPVASAPERDQLVSAGQADGMAPKVAPMRLEMGQHYIDRLTVIEQHPRVLSSTC